MFDTLFGGSCFGPSDSLVAFHLPPAYGYVVLTAVGSFFVLLWQGFQVIFYFLSLIAQLLHPLIICWLLNKSLRFQSKSYAAANNFAGWENAQTTQNQLSNYVFRRQCLVQLLPEVGN